MEQKITKGTKNSVWSWPSSNVAFRSRETVFKRLPTCSIASGLDPPCCLRYLLFKLRLQRAKILEQKITKCRKNSVWNRPVALLGEGSA